MSGILEAVQGNRDLEILRNTLLGKGCSICGNETLPDINDIIDDELTHVTDPVVNAILAAGPGIKITPFDRKGYKISATDEATLTSDISERLTQGMSIHKALFDIVNKQIPCAMHKAAAAPAIVEIELFCAASDGIDYYDNKAFPRRGQGRKTGLHPYTWYMKIYTFSQAEPIYVDMGGLVEAIKSQAICRARKDAMKYIDIAMKDHLKRYHDIYPDEPDPDEPGNGCCCGCPNCGEPGTTPGGEPDPDEPDPDEPVIPDPDEPVIPDPDEPGGSTGCGCGCAGDGGDGCNCNDINFNSLIDNQMNG